MLDFIPPLWAGILLILGVLGFLFRNRLSNMVAGRLPFFPAKTWLMVFIIVGLLAGGIGWIGSAWGDLTGNVASIGIGADGQEGVMGDVAVDCLYSACLTQTSNITCRQDPNSNNKVYLDVDENAWLGATDTGTADEIHVNFTCSRAGGISEDGKAHIVVKGQKFTSEVSTTDTATYTIIDTSARPSAVFSGDYEQDIHVGEGTTSTADTEEEVYLTFSEGENDLNLMLLGDLDRTAMMTQNNYTQRDIVIYQRINGQDTPLAYVTVNHIP